MEVIWSGTLETAAIKSAQIIPAQVVEETPRNWTEEVLAILKRSKPKTMPELAAKLGVDQDTVTSIIYRLKREGKITHGPEMKRSKYGRLCRTYCLVKVIQ